MMNASNAKVENKRTCSDSSVLSDHHEGMSKKLHVTPLISEEDEDLPVDIRSLARFFVGKINDLHSSINSAIGKVSEKIDLVNNNYTETQG